VQPISFDIVLSAVTPPFFEKRNLVRNRSTGRVDVDVIRYHQGGRVGVGNCHRRRRNARSAARQVVRVPGPFLGVRQAIGEPLVDLIPERRPPAGGRGAMKWTPAFFQHPDGTYYETALFVIEGAWAYSSAYLNETDGTQLPVRTVKTRIDYDTRTRYVRGGQLELTMETGERRTVDVEVLGESGFLLKTAGYGAWAGHKHGAWKGKLHIEGEYIADCSDDQHLRTLGQFRDTPIRVRDGDAVGYGIMESLIGGVWPELGLTADSDHKLSYT
jgi:hypothetical protein